MTTMHPPYPELAEGTYITPNPASSFDNEYNNLTKHDLLEKESVRLTYSARQNPTLKSVHDFIKILIALAACSFLRISLLGANLEIEISIIVCQPHNVSDNLAIRIREHMPRFRVVCFPMNINGQKSNYRNYFT